MRQVTSTTLFTQNVLYVEPTLLHDVPEFVAARCALWMNVVLERSATTSLLRQHRTRTVHTCALLYHCADCLVFAFCVMADLFRTLNSNFFVVVLRIESNQKAVRLKKKQSQHLTYSVLLNVSLYNTKFTKKGYLRRWMCTVMKLLPAFEICKVDQNWGAV
jgi:hypothetical protein